MADEHDGIQKPNKRKTLYIALPVIALFAGLLYYFVFATNKSTGLESGAITAATFIDTDADGIADHIDHCVEEKGTIENYGCLNKPESEKDEATKVEQSTDSRAQISESQVLSDSGNDGQTAALTSAQTTETSALESSNTSQIASAASVESTSPAAVEPVVEPVVEPAAEPVDKDADGVADDADACPDTAGPNNGCPAKVPAAKPPSDLDTDGVADKDDKCPDIAGSPRNSGCPARTSITLTPEEPVTESEEKLIQDAGFSIQFDEGNSVLTDESIKILLEVAKVLNRYPDINLEAHGFTDSEGSAQINKKLSLQRAQSCIDVVENAGVDKSRLKALGFGEERPIASNSTDQGRKQNRRVEFKLIR